MRKNYSLRCAVEHEGDLLTHEVIDKLNRTFVTPIDREDIHALAGQIDDVCDILQALSDRMQLYDLGNDMPEFMRKMADLLQSSALAMADAVKAFHNFRHNSRVRDHCIKIKGIENAADDLLKHALAGLFQDRKPDDRHQMERNLRIRGKCPRQSVSDRQHAGRHYG